MAVTTVPSESVLRLKFNTGVDGEGNPVYENKYLHDVKPDALDADLYEVAQALAGLVADTLDSITRTDSAEIINETV